MDYFTAKTRRRKAKELDDLKFRVFAPLHLGGEMLCYRSAAP
jgi:hypothetical protein